MNRHDIKALRAALRRAPSISAQYAGASFVKIELADGADAKLIYELLEKAALSNPE